MSGLTKKSIYADKTLSTILGVKEGEFVSYAELSKGLHKYIKDKNLKNPQIQPAPPSTQQAAPIQQAVSTPVAVPGIKKCRDCGADIPSVAVFCDMCGVSQ